jgi:hypothetical protein
MLPQSDRYVTWASSGEIDILEARGQEPGKILGTLHHGGPCPVNIEGTRDDLLPSRGTIADFHVYSLEGEPVQMLVAYVHVDNRNDGYAKPPPRGVGKLAFAGR